MKYYVQLCKDGKMVRSFILRAPRDIVRASTMIREYVDQHFPDEGNHAEVYENGQGGAFPDWEVYL